MNDVHWVRTVGGPSPGDPRDGEMHELFGALPDHFDLEPWDGDPDGGSADGHARYFRSGAPPVTDDEGRVVWLYEFRLQGDS